MTAIWKRNSAELPRELDLDTFFEDRLRLWKTMTEKSNSTSKLPMRKIRTQKIATISSWKRIVCDHSSPLFVRWFEKIRNELRSEKSQLRHRMIFLVHFRGYVSEQLFIAIAQYVDHQQYHDRVSQSKNTPRTNTSNTRTTRPFNDTNTGNRPRCRGVCRSCVRTLKITT